jgi:hypothetical protein
MHNISHTKLVYVRIRYYTLVLILALVTAVTRVLLNFIGLYVKFMTFSPDFNQTYVFPHVLVIFLNTNCKKILSSG